MPTDYDQIREENISRYGWDTAVLELLGQLYSDRTHFIFELLQNAEDAGATDLTFELFADRLELRHDGRPFTTADVRGLCGVSQGTKAGDLTQIGKFGIGFKSVYAYTATPRVSSGEEHFRIEKFVRPFSEHQGAGPAQGTVFVFPFDRTEVPAEIARDEIAAALAGLDAETLLFLRNLDRISASGAQLPGIVLRRTVTPGNGASRRVRLTTDRGTRRTSAQWLVWARRLDALGEPDLAVEIAFAVRSELDARHLVRRETSPLVVSFPTEKETFLGFGVAGPYRTTPARDNVPEHDEWNQALARETASLVGDALAGLRDEGLLTADVLLALPLEPARFASGSMFWPVFESARTALATGEFVPVSGGGYRPAAQVRLPADADLRELLTAGQLGELLGAAGPVYFVDESISADETAVLWRYLRDEAGVTEITAEDVVVRLGGEFLAAQPDDWLGQLYQFLYRHQPLWLDAGPATAKPIIRLTDGTQIAPYAASGLPAAYLPGPAPSEFPSISPAVASLPGARRFLEALGFAEPDAASEVLDFVLPRYADADVAGLDRAQHETDLELVALALSESPPAARDELLVQVRRTEFLVGENAATGERRLCRPGELYQRTRPLEAYFDGNEQAWFADDRYGPWRAQLRGMGVRESVPVHARAADELGHVLVADEFARHERGLAGFDPAARLDGLDHALAHPSFARSEFVWNALLEPSRHLIAGVVESSARLGYADSRKENALSVIGELARAAAWLPAGDGSFRRPGELRLADLPETFQRDEVLAGALGMIQSVVDEANRELGLPQGFLRRLSEHQDLVDQIERELRRRESGGSVL